MKKSNVLISGVLGLLSLLIFPSVLATATMRPISDFTDTNDNAAGYYSPATNLVLFTHGGDFDPEKITDCLHHGSILERVLEDGRILLKIDLHVKSSLVLIFWVQPLWFTFPPIYIGEMDYHFTQTVILEGNPGDPIPNIYDVWFGGVGVELTVHITGSGNGYFTDYAGELGLGSPGESAKLVLNQLGMLKPDFEPDHPKYDGLYLWPAELTFIH